jgi:hypothetical protein
METVAEPQGTDEEQCKKDAKEYFTLTQQIADLTKQRAVVAKRLIPSMESLQHKSYRLSNEGILAVQTTTRPKPFTAAYLKTQLLPLFHNDESAAKEFVHLLSTNREQAMETRLVIKPPNKKTPSVKK